MDHEVVNIQRKHIEQALSHISAVIADASEFLQQAMLQEQAVEKMLLQSQMDLEELYLFIGEPADKDNN